MRGEHRIDLLRYIDAVGSSPHARGALVARGIERLQAGIIPACAGST